MDPGWALIAILFGLAVGLIVSAVSQDDIEAKCRDHEGVQQVVPHTWQAIKGGVTVVCKDGRVLKVN